MAAVVLAFAAAGRPAFSSDRISDLRTRVTRESNPVNKAKLMPQLGDAEFAEIDKDVAAGNLREALLVLQHYLEEVQSCEKALDASGIDAEKHPSGFKQLQYSLPGSLRRLDNLIVGLTADEQGPFLAARKDLNEMDMHLIRELFPHEPKS